MANYSLVVNSKFRPYSFDELVRPYLMYKLAYDELEKALSDLSSKSGIWKALINPTLDSDAYNKVNTFTNDLDTVGGSVSKYGLSPASQRLMTDIKRRYDTVILPIDTAYKKREELTKELRILKALDDSIMFNIDYSKAPLSQLQLNPNSSYIPISGNALAAKSAEMALPLSKRISPEENAKLKTILENQYTLILLGVSPDRVMNAMDDKELRKIIDTVFNSSGLNTFDAALLQQGMASIIRGLYKGIGGSTPVANGEYMNLSLRASLAMQQAGLDILKEELDIEKKSKGLLPFLVDKNTGTEYYSNGTTLWEITSDGTLLNLLTTSSSTREGTPIDSLSARGDSSRTQREQLVIHLKEAKTSGTSGASGVIAAPLYFDAWSKGAHNGFEPTNDSFADKASLVPIKYSDITGSKAKKYIRNYIRLSIEGAINLNDEAADRLASLMHISRDFNVITDDNFVVTFPGLDRNGKLENKVMYQGFIKEALKEISNSENLIILRNLSAGL